MLLADGLQPIQSTQCSLDVANEACVMPMAMAMAALMTSVCILVIR